MIILDISGNEKDPQISPPRTWRVIDQIGLGTHSVKKAKKGAQGVKHFLNNKHNYSLSFI